jgi:hypothetical protein
MPRHPCSCRETNQLDDSRFLRADVHGEMEHRSPEPGGGFDSRHPHSLDLLRNQLIVKILALVMLVPLWRTAARD